jgi:hypothetical protein
MGADDQREPLLVLPEDLRAAFKDPFGPIYTDPEALLAEAGAPVITVGDMVTYHLEAAGDTPQVALVDGRTEREAVDEAIREALGNGDDTISNPPGTLTAALLEALVEAVDADEPRRLFVEGEEDLAAIPAVLAAPVGATVVYGQPQEGMVSVSVTADAKETFRELLGRLDGDTDRALDLLE